MIYGHGDDLYRYKDMVRANFSSNIYQKADMTALKKHLADRLDLIANYPEPAPLSLERALADEAGVSTENVTVTAGATESIYLIAQDNVRRLGSGGFTNVIMQPTFSEYADACRLSGSPVVSNPAEAAGRRVNWMCNPNNPTGSVIPARDLLRMADERPDELFIIDQSYEHYTHEPAVSDAEAARRPNMILLHSMTKRFCVPGLRLGYAVACGETARRLKGLRHPWSVNALAIEAGLFMIGSKAEVIPALDGYLGEAQRLRRCLCGIEGISVSKTFTNFMLARIKGHTAARLKEYLVKRHGLLIRDASNFDGLDGSYFRVAAQDREADDALVAGIREFVDTHNNYKSDEK